MVCECFLQKVLSLWKTLVSPYNSKLVTKRGTIPLPPPSNTVTPIMTRVLLLLEREWGWGPSLLTSRTTTAHDKALHLPHHSSLWQPLGATGTETQELIMEAEQFSINTSLCFFCLKWECWLANFKSPTVLWWPSLVDSCLPLAFYSFHLRMKLLEPWSHPLHR